MARNKKGYSGKTKTGLLIAGVAVGLFATTLVLSQRTNLLNHASGPTTALPSNAITNLNSAGEITTTNNPDGTMGPATWRGNASNALPYFLKGNLFFKVIDPPQGAGKSDDSGKNNKPPKSVSITQQPTQAGISQNPSISQVVNISKNPNNGPQDITALNITIKKVEVHMAYQGEPNSEKSATPGASQTPKPTGKPVDHWETLNVVTPVTVDFVALANSHDVSALGITQLAAGRYTEIRLYVSDATATLMDGTVVPLTMHGHDNIVRIKRPFSIYTQQETSLTMDLDAQHTVVKTGNNYLLKPVISRLIEEKK